MKTLPHGNTASVLTKIQLPEQLKDELSRLARANGRSLSYEIVTRLQASIDGDSMTGEYDAVDVAEGGDGVVYK